jgi:radical SAM superfamily enzyme YgiQ (UPF0313 family)
VGLTAADAGHRLNDAQREVHSRRLWPALPHGQSRRAEAAAAIAEFDINQRPLDIAEALLAREPKILGFGVYIWNVTETTEVIAAIKRVRPEVIVILGGPEVSYETESQEIVALADYVITGEADLKFAEVCRQLLTGRGWGSPRDQRSWPRRCPSSASWSCPTIFTPSRTSRIASSTSRRRAAVRSPVSSVSVSLDIPVRQVPLDKMLAALQRLLDRGVKNFKFVDRTFNLNLNVSRAFLQFFLDRYQPGLFFTSR